MDPARCSARSKRSGERCRRWATPGSPVCSFHGSKSPQALAAARRRLMAEQVREIEAQEAEAWAEVEDVDPAAKVLHVLLLAYGRLRAVRRAYAGALLSGDPPAVRLEGEALDRVARFGKIAVDAGLLERRVRIAEQTGALIVAALERALAEADLGLGPPARAELARRFGTHLAVLEAVEAGASEPDLGRRGPSP